jgi:cell division protein FtsX
MPARRALVLAGLSALTLLPSACGGASKSAHHPGTVKVYFCTTVAMPDCTSNASAAQERAAGRALRRIPDVTKVVFVSKATALKMFKKRIRKVLPANPLPDVWVATVSSDQYDERVGKRICSAHYPGVEPCPSANSSQYGHVGGATWAPARSSALHR